MTSETAPTNTDPAKQAWLAVQFAISCRGDGEAGDYAIHCGANRLARLFARRHIPVSWFCDPHFIQRAAAWLNDKVASGDEAALLTTGISDDLRRGADDISKATGVQPAGHYASATATPAHSRQAAAEAGFAYTSNGQGHDLPYVDQNTSPPILVIPQPASSDFSGDRGVLALLQPMFDMLHQEGRDGTCRLWSVMLDAALCGRPEGAYNLALLLDHILDHEKLWLCRRVDVARRWQALASAST